MLIARAETTSAREHVAAHDRQRIDGDERERPAEAPAASDGLALGGLAEAGAQDAAVFRIVAEARRLEQQVREQLPGGTVVDILIPWDGSPAEVSVD